MAATGSAVGLGNIWKFPYITGENGGGAFVLVYLACILIIGVPVMMAEVLFGRRAQRNPINTMRHLSAQIGASQKWQLIGWMGVLAGLLIMMFYSVVGGWALDYILTSAQGQFSGGDNHSVGSYFSQLTDSIHLQIAWHSAFTLLTISVVAAGVTKGLGNAVRILMPLLFVLLLLLLGYSYQEGEFMQAARFMFSFDTSRLTGQSVLTAMGHAFFTLSLGMGAIMAYGSYMPRDASIAKTVVTIALFDTLIALIAGMTIFPLVFAHNIEPSAGPSLMFISLPIAFGNMDGGTLFGTLFFVLVSIAAWSSAISLIEPGVAWMNETLGIKRLPATAMLGLIAWSGGIGCIYSSGLFNFLDKLTANFMLPIGGLLIAIFAGWIMKRSHLSKELGDLRPISFNLWYASIRVFAPIGILVIFLYELYKLLDGLGLSG
jgi:NSS family neurotransmitter:Na+ symporter